MKTVAIRQNVGVKHIVRMYFIKIELHDETKHFLEISNLETSRVT